MIPSFSYDNNGTWRQVDQLPARRYHTRCSASLALRNLPFCGCERFCTSHVRLIFLLPQRVSNPANSLSVVITRILVTGWSIYAVWRSKFDENVYEEILSNKGTPCSLEIFSTYFERRLPILVILRSHVARVFPSIESSTSRSRTRFSPSSPSFSFYTSRLCSSKYDSTYLPIFQSTNSPAHSLIALKPSSA